MVEPAWIAGAGLSVVLLLHTVDPREPGHYPTCPFLLVTGLYCPGCGGMRAVAALTDGNMGAAVGYNPLAVVAVVAVVGVFISWSRRRWLGLPRQVTTRPWVPLTVAGVIAVFWLLRNLPGGAWLSPV